ncbi:hypothetical protein GF354_03855, partial [Candidatus Peregrinibacteria bacterium]|nr:hypothetical protein [Candidatus Peregrinibacteria bacterium]
VLGWVKCEFSAHGHKSMRDFINFMQENLYKAMTMIGGSRDKLIDDSDTVFLERKMHELKKEADIGSEFITPGKNELSARLDIARAVCRRAERSYVKYAQDKDLKPCLQKYINRLSDTLFVLARYFD